MNGEAVVEKRGAAQRIHGILLSVYRFVIRNYAYFLSFLLPALILFVAYIIFGVWPFGDRSVLSLDLNAQYVYYFDYMYDVFAGEESLFYSWSRNLSGEFAGIIGYYLASPFNLLVWIWNRNWITEGLMTMMLAKAAASGLTMCFLLKKHRGYSDITALLFSVMYALCGFFVVQTMDPMWLDGLVALPLVAMGVERICDKRRFVLYILSLVYIFVANFYIGYMVGIFSALYFLYYLASGKSENRYFGQYCGATLMYGAASVSAILMSCFMILPVYKSLSNGKFEFTEPDYSLYENFDIADIFIRLFPTTYDTVRMEGMPILYAGTLALVFTVLYFLTRKFSARERISGGVLIGFLLLCMYIRPVDMMWHGGQMPNWLPYRYSFLVSFLLVLFGAQAFERIKSVRGRSFGAAFGILLAMLLYADIGNDSYSYDAVLTIAIPLVVLAVICILAYVFRKYADSRGMKITVCAVICLECLLNTAMSLYQMHEDIVFSNRETYRWDIPYTREVTEQVHEQDDGFYRMEKTYHRCVNDPIALQMYGMSHSSSTLNSTAIRLLKYLGFTSREHYSRYDGATVLTDDIFGVKYILAKDEKTLPYTNTLPVESDQGISAYINEDALGFAYLADSAVAELDIDPFVITPSEEELIRTEKENDGETTYFPVEQPFLLQNELARALAGEEQADVFVPVTDLEFDSENIRLGTTTDAHHSHRKKDEADEAWISWEVTAQADGPIYMYLPTVYERESKLFINGEYRGNYYLYENYSIEYLGTYSAGESFEVKLELLDSALYFKEAQFYYVDSAAMEQFSAAMAEKNSATTLERTGGDRLELSVNAAEDSVLFTTIPMEDGWTVLIDGEEAPIITTMDGALIAVNVPMGEHEIVLDFFPAGMKTGLVLTACGALIFALMFVALRIIRRMDKLHSQCDTQV
ncbi:MAG: YfhO family protein [Oscillospiraceae bacterium]|nr:YfhO family protein [Oscillospiraceae bacterium]